MRSDNMEANVPRDQNLFIAISVSKASILP